MLSWSGVARAQPVQDASRAAARELGYAGVESYQAGEYPAASTKLEKAYRVLKVPSLGLWSARALIKTGHWVEAAERFRQVLTLEPKGGDAPVQAQAKRDASADLDALVPRIPKLIITLAEAADNVELKVDGYLISTALLGEGLPANPGAHTIVAQAGARSATRTVTLIEGGKKHVKLRFSDNGIEPAETAAAPTAPGPRADAAAPTSDLAMADQGISKRKIAGWVLVGTGGAGLALGATTAILALGKKSDLQADQANCHGTSCLPSRTDSVNSYETLRTVSSIGLIGGAALATLGVIVLITDKKDNQQSSSAAGKLWLSVSNRGGVLGGVFQ